MKIIDIRNTQSQGWTIDIQIDGALLPYSEPYPTVELTDEDLFLLLIELVNSDERHIAIYGPRTPSQIEMDMMDREWKETYQSLL